MQATERVENHQGGGDKGPGEVHDLRRSHSGCILAATAEARHGRAPWQAENACRLAEAIGRESPR